MGLVGLGFGLVESVRLFTVIGLGLWSLLQLACTKNTWPGLRRVVRQTDLSTFNYVPTVLLQSDRLFCD